MTLINSKIHFILLAGGDSLRFSSNTNKLLAKFKNKNLLTHNIDFLKELKFKKITVVINTIKKANISNFDDLEINNLFPRIICLLGVSLYLLGSKDALRIFNF